MSSDLLAQFFFLITGAGIGLFLFLGQLPRLVAALAVVVWVLLELAAFAVAGWAFLENVLY